MYTFYKKRVGALAAVLVAALLLTGTFAWSSFTQRAFNSAWEDWEDENYGGRIRDEYDGEGSGEHNKDVFAENFGTRDIFVRVRLSEFLSVGGNPVIDGMLIDNVDTWAVYCSEDNNVNVPREGSDITILHGDEPDGYGIRWTLGHNADKYFMPTHNHATHTADDIASIVPDLFAHYDTNLMSEATGRGVDAIAAEARYGTFDETAMTHASDFFTYGVQTGPGDGSHNWAVGQTHFAPLIITITDEDANEPFTELTIAQTLVEARLAATSVEGVDFRWVDPDSPILDAEGVATGEYEVVVIGLTGSAMYAAAAADGLRLEIAHEARQTMQPEISRNEVNDEPYVQYFGITGFITAFNLVMGYVEGVSASLVDGEIVIEGFNGIMTSYQWHRLGRPNGNFWILDNNFDEETGECDPWFYWNGWLPAGEATSLLLDAIYLPSRNAEWEHVIHVEADFFTERTIDDEHLVESMSPLARAIFYRHIGRDNPTVGLPMPMVVEIEED